MGRRLGSPVTGPAGGTQDTCPWACLCALEDSNNLTLPQKNVYSIQITQKELFVLPPPPPRPPGGGGVGLLGQSDLKVGRAGGWRISADSRRLAGKPTPKAQVTEHGYRDTQGACSEHLPPQLTGLLSFEISPLQLSSLCSVFLLRQRWKISFPLRTVPRVTS